MQQILLLAGHVVDPVNKKVVAAENIPRTRGIGERLVKIVVHVPKEIDLASEFLEQARDSFQVFLAVHPRFLCYRTVQTFGSDAGVPEIAKGVQQGGAKPRIRGNLLEDRRSALPQDCIENRARPQARQPGLLLVR